MVVCAFLIHICPLDPPKSKKGAIAYLSHHVWWMRGRHDRTSNSSFRHVLSLLSSRHSLPSFSGEDELEALQGRTWVESLDDIRYRLLGNNRYRKCSLANFLCPGCSGVESRIYSLQTAFHILTSLKCPTRRKRCNIWRYYSIQVLSALKHCI